MTKAKHTPLPWTYMKVEKTYTAHDGQCVTVATVYQGEKAIARCHNVEDAAFIVKACNEYYQDKATIAELENNKGALVDLANKRLDTINELLNALHEIASFRDPFDDSAMISTICTIADTALLKAQGG